MKVTARDVALFFFVVAIAAALVSFPALLVINARGPAQTHQLLCQGMSKSLRVYGMPRAEGVYLIVKFYKNKSTLSMVGPGCVILPEGEEE